MNPRLYAIVTGILFTAMALAQATRFFLRWEVMMRGTLVPVWPSAVACLVLVALAFWAFRVAARSK